MGEIKSAMEIALERTADIKGDPNAGRNRDLQNIGKKLAAGFLESGDEKAFVSAVKAEKAPAAAEGAFAYLFSQFQLPEGEDRMDKFKRVCVGFSSLLPGKGLPELFNQLYVILEQYFGDREQVKEMLTRQFAPKLRAKEQELSRMYGQEIHLQPEQDPEFVQLLDRNTAALKLQYEDTMAQARERINDAR